MSKNIFPEGDNPKDPMKRVGPEAQMELTRIIGRAATGFPNEAVIGAAVNVLVNSIRQTYPNGRDAEARYNELVGRFRSILLSHYDGVTGRRRSIFPFHQTISPDLVVDKDEVLRDKVNQH